MKLPKHLREQREADIAEQNAAGRARVERNARHQAEAPKIDQLTRELNRQGEWINQQQC